MRLRGLVGVMLVGCSACQCLQPVGEGDAGAVLDAGSSRDAGSAFDGGRSVDAGSSFDAGNAPDAGFPNDAGTTIDAGDQPDSGPIAFDGGIDAGAQIDAGQQTIDAGSPEVCDGIDNDLDGTIDLLHDGGALTQACPLQSGVCAGSFSKCINHAFEECEYGSDYQRVEDRCDGFDNDCDGRVDKSWPKLLVRSDAGMYPRVGSDVMNPQIFRVPTGLMLSLPYEMHWLAQDLSVTNSVAPPTSHYNGGTGIIRNGDGWARVLAWNEGFHPQVTTTYGVHLISADGGYDSADGSVVFVATQTFATGYERVDIAVLPTDAGWVTVSNGYLFPQYVYLNRDGTTSVQSLDAGFWRSENIAASSSNFYITNYWRCSVRRCGLDEQCTSYPITDAGLASCNLATLDPLTLSIAVATQDAWRDSLGNAVGYDSAYRPYATYENLTIATRQIRNDAGMPTHTVFASMTPSGWFDFEQLPTSSYPRYPGGGTEDISQYLPLEGHLGLMVFGELRPRPSGGCPLCEMGDYWAEYICLP